MVRHVLVLVMAAAFAALAIVGAIIAVALADPPRGGDRQLVVFPPWTGDEQALAAIVAAGGRPVRRLGLNGMWLVAFDATSGDSRLNALRLAGDMPVEAMMAGCAVPSPPPGARGAR